MNNFSDTSLVYFKNKEEDTLEALAFYEGSHIDSKGNAHIVSPEIIKALADKTNELLTQTDIPILTEHTKSPDNIRGIIKDANSFIARHVNASDVERNPKLSSALGKLGLFVSNIRLTDEKLLNNIKNGIGKAISLGIDFKNQLVRELSFVTVPALNLASVFNSNSELTYLLADTNKTKIINFMETAAVTLEEALQTTDDNEELKSEAIELLCTFLSVIENISAMSDEDLGNYQVASKEELYQAQLETFMTMLDEQINPFGKEEMNQQQGQIDPRMEQQQAQYSYPLAITTFNEMDQYVSEFGFVNALKAGVKVASKTTGIGNKLKVAGTAVGRGVLGKKGFGAASSALGTGLKTAKTGIANAASGGLNKVGQLGSKLATKPGILNKVGTGLMKKSSGLADKIGVRRMGKYNSSNKLSRFIHK